MIVVGGEGETDLNDLWALDLKTKTWHEIEVEGNFGPRRSHTAVSH